MSASQSIYNKEKLLNNISSVLGESIDYKTTIQNIGKILVPFFADYVRIAIVNDNKQIEDLAIFHENAKKIPLVKGLYNLYKNSSSTYGVPHILQTGKPEIMQYVKGKELTKSSKIIKNTVKKLNLTSYMGVPLNLQKKVIGVITFSSTRKERIFTKEDFELAKEIALRISFVVENARLFDRIKRELETKQKSNHELTRLLTILDQTYDAIIVWEWQGKITYWNTGATELYGYSKKQALGKSTNVLLETIHPIPFSEIEKILLKEGRWEGELQHTTKSSSKLFISSKKVLFTDFDGKRYVLETNRNITLQKTAQTNRAQLAAIVSSSNDAIISKNLNSIIQTWNKAAKKMFGYTPEEAKGKSIYLITPHERYNEEKKIIQLLITGKRIKHFNTVRQTKSGKLINVSQATSPLYDENGKIIGASTIIRDISEETRQQNNLRFFSKASKILSSSLDYRQTLKNVAKLAVPHIADWCTVHIITEKGIELLALAHINPEKVAWAKELNRNNPPDPNGKTGVPKVIRTGQIEFVPKITEKMILQSVTSKEQLELLRKLQLSSVMIIPIKTHNNVIGAITFISAESGHYYTKSDLQIAKELAIRAGIAIENARLYSDAQNAIGLRDEFISLASHELKTPITSLKLYLQVLVSKYNKNENISKAYFERVDKQIYKLTNLINDLLNVTKIRNGKLEFRFKKIDLNNVVKESVDALKATSQKHTLEVLGKIDKKVSADQYRIYQVLTNLITNAMKYSPEGGKIFIHLSSKKTKAVVSVEDFGIGISLQEQKKIFNRFYRVEKNEGTQTFPGLGMGLYISKEIVKRHGGDLSVVSSKGKGSKFSFTLPY